MKYALLVKSLKSKKPAASDGDELSTEEKLLGILEERVRDAVDDSRRRICSSAWVLRKGCCIFMAG